MPEVSRSFPIVLADVGRGQIAPLGLRKGERLFTGDGANSPLLETALACPRAFQDEVVRTQASVGLLGELGLLKAASLRAEPPAMMPSTINGLMIVDEDRLRALDDEDLVKLARSSDLALVHAHPASLAGLADPDRRNTDRRALAAAGNEGGPARLEAVA